MTPPTDRADITDAIEPNESREARPRKLPTEINDPADPMDPTDRIDPTDPTDRIDPLELIERMDPVELIDQRELPFERTTPTVCPPSAVTR
jgi:hypothetical protein